MGIKFSNLATTSLASGITNSATTITVVDGSVFPALGSGDFFFASIDTPPNAPEIIKVTAISSNTLTVVRGQDGTTATTHASGENIALRVVAAVLEDLRDNAGETYTAGTNLSLSGTTFNLNTNLSGLGTISSGAITSTGNMSLSNSNAGNSITINRTDAGTSAIFHVGSSTGYVGTTSNHPFHIRQNDQSVITIGTSQNVNIATGGLEVGGTTVIDSSRNLTNVGTISSGAITSSGRGTFDELTLTGGSDNLTFNEGSGDWTINNAQQNNGITIFDGTAGVAVNYNGAAVAKFDGSGGMNLITGSLRVGGTAVIDSSRNLSSIGTISSGAITITDGTTNGASTIGAASDQLLLDTNADTGITIRSGASSTGVVSFASPTDHNVGQVYYDHSNDSMVLRAGDATALTIDSSQNATLVGTLTANGGVTVDVTSSNGVRVTGTDSVADAAFTTMLIDHNASGSDTTTADQNHIGLKVDMDSSATGGGTVHEHRLYGIHNHVKSTGDSDLIYGLYSSAEAEQTAGQVTTLYGGYFQALGDVTGGTLSNSYGVHALNSVANASGTTISNNYALYGKTLVGAGQDSNVASAVGVYGEVEIDSSGASTTLSTAQVFAAQFDNDSAGDVTITTGYLYYGNYAGTLPSTAYGVYIADAVRNYFAGTLTAGLGSTTAAAYGFNGDLNTGMYSPANHQVALLTNGTNRLNVNSSGAQVTGALTTTGDINLNGGNLTRNAHNTGHLEGSYNSVGSSNNSASNPIYTIGSSYNPGSTTLGSMYGIGFTKSAASFISGDLDAGVASGWGMYVAEGGDARIFLNASYGTINSTGQHYANGSLVWNAGNDGAGSGLDADLLDGTTWATLDKLVGGTSFYVDAGNLNGLRFWNGSGSYRISMSAHSASGAGRVSGETTSDYNMYFKMDGGTNRGFVFQSGTSNRAGIDAAGNIRTVANVDCSYLRADRIYSNNDGSSGYFYNDTSTRTAYAGGDFYIQTSVGNFYNYATNQYIGNSSGNNIYFRSNPISGTGWDITGAGRLTTRDHRINAGYHLQRLDHHSGHMEGSYNSVGANDSKSNPIYTIGSSYNPASTTLSNMYGIGFTHTNASFIGFAGSAGWGLYVASAGYARVYLSGQSGSGHFTGNITAYASDRRLKTRIQTIDSALEKVTRIRGVEFDWVDDITSEYDFHPQQMHETGVIAQEIQAVIPDAVVEAPMNGNYTAKCGTDHKFLTVDKEKIVPLLIEAIKELKSEVDALKSQLKEKP